MFQQKLPQQEQGFTLVEVLVAILIVSVFIGTSMQAMVLATVFKVRAREYTKATTWAQEDIDNSRFQATLSNLPFVEDNAATASVNEQQRTCGKAATSSQSNGYAATLQNNLAALNSSKSITVNSKTYTAIAGTTANPNPRLLGDKDFWLLRNATNSPTSPYSVLQLSYLVVPDNNGSPMASSNPQYKQVAAIYTEVIPDAAFQCPYP
jgi:prepilin-type N-terminal cleavage/methylation domain-containing protein